MRTLYIIATPIGNLNDISQRALSVLREVDVIAAEDTRHSQKLLTHYHITTPLIAYHEHNERESCERLIALCEEGKSIALLSDAGTPLISDPGYHLVKAAHAAQIKVVPIPGACAAITALCAAGLPSDRFIFEGFLPVKSHARQSRLQELREEMRTLIFYEAPHRIEEMLEDLLSVFGKDREVTLARELTKTFETIHKSTLNELVLWMKKDSNQKKGEFVIVVAGINEDELQNVQQEKAIELLTELMNHLPLKKAVQLSAQMSKTPKNTLYDLALHLHKEQQHDTKI